MNTELNPKLLEATQRLADGQELDWIALERELDPQLIASLRSLEALSSCMASLRGEPAPSLPQVKEHFAHLEVLSEIARGSGGVVYRAHDPVIRRDVALKCTRSKGADAALLREARLMAMVDHPGVLKVHGAAEQDGVVGYWSDLIEGETLAAWARAHPRLNAGEISAIALELCAALAAIHAVDVVHGDVKPANIVRHPSGRWVLVDFGSSSHRIDPLASSGTPLYLAPEILEGGKSSKRSDIYALGIVLFYLATGHHPIEAEGLDDFLELHRSGAQQRLLDLRPDLPLPLIDAIESALAPDPARRVASAGALAARCGLAGRLRGDASANERFSRWPIYAWAAAVAMLVAGGLFFINPASTPSAPVGPEVDLVRVEGDLDRSLRDGDTLVPGDSLALRYLHSETSYVYVINQDAKGSSFQLFPVEGTSLMNPIAADTPVRLPGASGEQQLYWQVTSRGGQEDFYVIVSPTPLPEVVDLRLASASSSNLPELSYDGIELAMGPMRGVGSLVAREPSAERAGALAHWMEELQARHRGIVVRRFQLRNS